MLVLLLVLTGGMVNGVWGATYTYHIVDGIGSDIITATSTESVLQAPSQINSPWCELTYWNSATGGTQLQALPGSDANIYVRYTVKVAYQRYFTNTCFSMKIGGNQCFASGGMSILRGSKDSNDNSDDYGYFYMTGDPYQLQIYSVAKGESGGPLTYIRTQSNNYEFKKENANYCHFDNTTPNEYYHNTFMVVGFDKDVNASADFSLRFVGGYANQVEFYIYNYIGQVNQFSVNSSNTANYKVQFTPIYLSMYHVINGAGNVAVSYRNYSETLTLSASITMPEDIKTPLIDDKSSGAYLFFDTKAKAYAYTTASTNTERSTAAAQQIKTYGQVLAGGNIYVGYHYNSATAPSGTPILDGTVFYQIKGNGGTAEENALYYYAGESNRIVGGSVPGTTNDYFWCFQGSDPYNVTIVNKDGKKAYCNLGTSAKSEVTHSTSLDASPFMILKHGSTGYATIAMRNIRTGDNSVYNNRTVGDKYYLYFWCYDTDRVYMEGNESKIQYYSDRADGTYRPNLSFTEVIPGFTYTFCIVDNAGRIAIKYALKGTEKLEPATSLASDYTAIPQAIRSPYLKSESLTFYATATQRVDADGNPVTDVDGRAVYDLADPITKTPDTDGANIYVRYTTDHRTDFALRLGGARSFDMRVNGQYVYDENSVIKHKSMVDNNSDGDPQQEFLWYLTGKDPYAVQIENVNDKKYFTSNTGDESISLSGTPTTFIITGIKTSTRTAAGKEIEDIQVELMAATGEDAATQYFNIGRGDNDEDNVKLFNNTDAPQGDSRLRVVLNVAKLHISYCLVDLGGKVILEIPAGGEIEKNFPAEWRSPLATNFQYWIAENFKNPGSGTFELKDGQKEIASLAESVDGKVYVTYEATTDVELDGRKKVEDNQEGKMYLLKFKNGISFVQENGKDGFNPSATKAVYPYNNGEANLYIYGDEQWDEQQLGAASTRTRWAWYVEGGDPYRARFSSFQAQASSNAYLRTYRPDGYGEVVTGVITKNSSVPAAQTPTEYMILGSAGNYKLVTTELLGGSHVTVNGFEQYWKNNPTALNILLETKGLTTGSDAAKAYAEELNGRDLNATEKAALSAKGWHTYKAWANINSWTSTTGKTYQYTDHWFQTISMDNDGSNEPVFDLVPIDLDGVLVLLDNHGWEIMRKPMARKGADNTTERNDAIRIYDSPMVERYYFNYNYSKVPGYHKYKPTTTASKASDNVQTVGTGTSLADYVNYYSALSNNGTLRDVYVTYDVKAQYADAYTGGQTFVIRQDSKLASTTDGSTITPVDVPAELDSGVPDDITDEELYWYLKPNADIDDEMGITYGQTVTEGDGTVTVITKDKAEMQADYEAAGQNGFDPYNLRIESKTQEGKYFTTNAGDASLSGGVWTSTSGNSVSLTNATATYNAEGHDATICKVSNATFLAVQDKNGNLRLMPRFDHSKVIEGFTALATQAAAQPFDDKKHPQTTLLYQPNAFTYIVVDNQGHEALHYTAVSSGAPYIPYKFMSPLATGFRFYQGLTKTGDTYDLTDIESKRITGSFSAADMTSGNVYVRYSYDGECDPIGLLKGNWLTMQVNGTDVKNDGGAIKSGGTKYPAQTEWQWRLIQSASDTPDPYAVNIYTATDAAATATSVSGIQRFVLLPHSSGTATDYALLVAGSESTTTYNFLNGNNLSTGATTATETDFATKDLITDAAKVTFADEVVAPFTSLQYKIVTLGGQIALKGDSLVHTSLKPSLPHWMRSPLMKKSDDTYTYYAGVTRDANGKYTAVNPTGTLKNLDIEDGKGVVYVRYDYTKSRTSTDLNGRGEKSAVLDLTGKVPYTFFLDEWQCAHEVTSEPAKKDLVRTYGGNTILNSDVKMLWHFTGNDPYEIKISNVYQGEDLFISSPAEDDTRFRPGVEAPETKGEWYPLVVHMKPDNDTDYPDNTFMVLPYSNSNNLALYVTGSQRRFLIQRGAPNDPPHVRVFMDDTDYSTRVANKTAPAFGDDGNFYFYPNVIYHVVTNKGDIAIDRASGYQDKTMAMPYALETPLIETKDYIFYSELPEWNGSELTTNEKSRLTAGESILSLTNDKLVGNVYIRYHYTPESSNKKYPNSIGNNETDSLGLDLSGNTWYSWALYSSFDGSSKQVKYNNLASLDNNSKLTRKAYDTSVSLSSRNMLWKFEGDDPYAIRIFNCSQGNKYLSGTKGSSTLSFSEPDVSTDYETFMLLRARAHNEGNSGIPVSSTGALLIPSGHIADNCFISGAGNNSNITLVSRNNLWNDLGNGSDQGGDVSWGWVYFYKAPVARKYRYHAYNQTKGEWTWTATLEHDWLTPVVLEDEIARLYCKYEKNTAGETDDVTGSNVFDTREALEASVNAQFYSDAAMTKRVFDEDGTAKTYDVYPAIDSDAIYDIYFKYQVDNEAEVSGRTLSGLTSSPADIAEDVKNRQDDGILKDGAIKANWWFMVLDTDEDVTATGTGGERTFTGKQYFLRREDNGKVGWMNNDYALHHFNDDNYNKWTYSRLAESFRVGENDAFREGRWLWAFVGDDPYNMRVLNMETAVGVSAEGEGIYTFHGADNCWTTVAELQTKDGDGNVTGTSYALSVPTAEPTMNDTWGLMQGNRYGSGEQTFNLISTAMTHEVDGHTLNLPLCWQMTTNSTTKQDSVAAMTRAADRSNAIQLLPYVPTRYEDVKVVIRRKDEVDAFKGGTLALNKMTTGTEKLYFSASDRKFVAGDKIDLSDKDTYLPFNVRRAFCEYELYRSDTPFDEIGTSYTVKAGPYPTTTLAKDELGNYMYDDDGRPIYTYTTGSGEPADGAQAVYAHYVVKSDIFLSAAPTQAEVEEMAANNDHVFFMDFPDPSKPDTYHHAYFDPQSTFYEQTGDLKAKRDKTTGLVKTEKKKWSGTDNEFVDDTELWYNHYQYRTTNNRMVSVPERLKWYFVGDPYRVQVYCTAGAWGSNKAETASDSWSVKNGKTEATVAAHLARFDESETNFQFVVDCVHLRVPDYSNIDTRQFVEKHNEDGSVKMKQNPDGTLSTEPDMVVNRGRNKPYYNDFYWEVVPAASGEEGTFALRFKEDNDLLGYRNVYYYLAHDGLGKVYEASGDQKSYNINLSYNTDNATQQSGAYKGYHSANGQNNVIKLVQPAKVYVTVNRKADDMGRPAKSDVVVDELSEYFGVGETLTEVPRHLQRKFVSYDWTDKELTESNATSISDCSDAYHSSTINDLLGKLVAKQKVNPVYKFTVNYTVNDFSTTTKGKAVHLFSKSDSDNDLQWLDITVGPDKWLYYNKNQDDPSQVSNYRTAVSDNSADGWNDGLKGLHWALVGDPYDFTILNRRRHEANDGAKWLAVNKTTIPDYKGTPSDSVIWTTNMVTAPTDDKTSSTAIAAASQATHFSTQMWKLSPQNADGTYMAGNADAYYFLRTASLKPEDSADSETNNYWRMVMKPYPDTGDRMSYFEMVPYALTDMSNFDASQYQWNYSKTMNGLGVVQQRLEIRTAVAKDEDKADNNCFDADVEIRTATGVLRLTSSNMEIRYGDAFKSLPQSLRRYGCNYIYCYLNYDEATNEGTEITNFGESDGDDGYDALHEAMTTASPGRVKLTYIYEVDDAAAQFFTTPQDAAIDEYTWMNTYFYWLQQYEGSQVEVQTITREFDHFVYNSAGQIVDEVWNEIVTTEIKNNPTEKYPTKGYLNTHTAQTPVFADETAQSENDRQKWSLTGDPYSFTMKNYAQYLKDGDATLTVSDDDNVLTQTYGATPFTMAVDAEGNPYLAVFDSDVNSPTFGNLLKLVDFEFSTTSDKSVHTISDTGMNPEDPTGNTLRTTYKNGSATVKPFFLTNLIKYADIVVYHLVMAHQHSLDYEETGLTEPQKTALKDDVNKRLYEFLKYWGIREHSNDSTYFLYYTAGVPTGYKESETDNIKALLKQKGTLRNFHSYPVVDQEVSRIGIGNRPQVPWYMKRQFCTYHMYQRDVMRSVVDIEGGQAKDADGHLLWMDEAKTKPAYNIKWVSIFDKSQWSDWNPEEDSEAKGDVKVTVGDVDKKQPSGYAEAHGLQGKELDKLYDCHYNRKVIIDVVYEVNTNQFRFADKGRNTTAWYTMMTNNENDGLINFTYLKGIGARLDRTHHYTNNYLWAPEGDPYGFVLRSRYSTINGTGWDDVAVTTKGKLPKGKSGDNEIYIDGNGESSPFAEPSTADKLATYTSRATTSGGIPFNDKRIIHRRAGQDGATTDGATNAVYEMFVGGYDDSFLMHPTAAWMDNNDANHQSYYLKHFTAGNTTELTKTTSKSLLADRDANWRLVCTSEQLIPYFKRSGYVGGLDPLKAQSFTNQDYYDQLQQSIASGTPLSFSTLRKIQELVYSGTFKDNAGNEVESATPRSSISLPMTFESANLLNMKPGYYRIQAFSEDALNYDGEDLRSDGDVTKDDVGIVGPRYISGYRFKSETEDPDDTNNDGGRWLHFFETDMEHASIRTFADLKAAINKASTDGKTERDWFSHKAMRGNIEILPADFDPSSIFQFASANSFNRYVICTQDMDVHARPGGTEGTGKTFGKTELNQKGSTPATGFDNRFRLDDIGGAAITLRTFSSEPTAAGWDDDVVKNLTTNYVCIDRNHRYRITCHTDNEMEETGDHYTTDGLNGIQDTKWLLQPVGIREEWPYNQMPLRVEVQKGGVKNQLLTGTALTATENEDPYYYGSLYVPFDTRLSNTTDAAFTFTGKTDESTSQVTMSSVSQMNNMGNPQYVPAAWPVILRTSLPSKSQDGSKHYVNMYLPYDAPQEVDKKAITLQGEYLEQKLSDGGDKTVMVFGLPFKAHTGDGAHEYDREKKQVGFYSNENWTREADNAYEATARTATDDQRNNKYVYHNKVYYVFDKAYVAPAPARRHIVAIFDGIDEPVDVMDRQDVPWPCDVYDLQGRRVAENETPGTLLKNHPALTKGVYIFGGRKVVVK